MAVYIHNPALVKRVIVQAKTMTPEQAEELAAAWVSNQPVPWDPDRAAAWDEAWDKVDVALWEAALAEARIAPWPWAEKMKSFTLLSFQMYQIVCLTFGQFKYNY
jgi:hypothetical protein